MITTNTGAKKIEGTDNWREIFDAHNDSVDAMDTVAAKILPVINGSTNNSGYTIASGEYFEANGKLYKATASIPTGSAWSSSASEQTDHGAINALNGKIATNSTGISASAASGVTLRNVRFDKFGLVVSGYVEVSATINGTTTLVTLNSDIRPRVKVFFPSWASSNIEFLGYVTIDTDGVVKLVPMASVSGAKYIAFNATFINSAS